MSQAHRVHTAQLVPGPQGHELISVWPGTVDADLVDRAVAESIHMRHFSPQDMRAIRAEMLTGLRSRLGTAEPVTLSPKLNEIVMGGLSDLALAGRRTREQFEQAGLSPAMRRELLPGVETEVRTGLRAEEFLVHLQQQHQTMSHIDN